MYRIKFMEKLLLFGVLKISLGFLFLSPVMMALQCSKSGWTPAKNDKLCAINMTYRFSMIFIGIQKSNLMRSAKKIQTPVLVVQGKNDTVVKPQASRDFFETLASVDKNILEPDTGHDLGGLFFSDTEIFNSESVFRFLQIK